MFGILRNAVIGVVLLGSIPVRWPLVGVIAEFLAPSHLGAMAGQSLPGLRGRVGARAPTPSRPRGPDDRARAATRSRSGTGARTGA